MVNQHDPALVYLNAARDPALPAKHVLIIGVGHYLFGRGPGGTLVAGDLRQLTSPPISARAMADWFIESFRNRDKPLGSVALLISEAPPKPYVPPVPAGAAPVYVPAAALPEVKRAASDWAMRLAANQDNMAVFYFCGHGASMGQQAALLLEDFGRPAAEYEGAIDLTVLRGTMKNSPVIQQVFLLDCCRTRADGLYENESTIGSRILSIPSPARGHQIPAQQFLLFPTIDGEQAFGVTNRVSVFTSSILDAVRFAAADYSTGEWRTTTANILSHIDRLVQHRLPWHLLVRSKPNALDASSFDFNEIAEPVPTRSFVTISDLSVWGDVELSCADSAGAVPPQTKLGRDLAPETCCVFDLAEGPWTFSGTLPQSPPTVSSLNRIVKAPVAYVKLEVSP